MARLKTAQPLRVSPLADIVAYGQTVLAEQAGNCFEHAAACAFLNIQRPTPTFDVVRMPGLDHAFVVIGQAFPAGDGLYPLDFGAWHPTAACQTFGLPDDCRELQALRWYRDNVMLVTQEGTADVARYYEIAPLIVAAINGKADSALIYRDIYYRFILPAAAAVERGERQTPYGLFAALLDEMALLVSMKLG